MPFTGIGGKNVEKTWDDLLQEMGYGPQARAEILARAEALAERKAHHAQPAL